MEAGLLGCVDPRVPGGALISAPEYALDSSLTPANDLYSLGCVLYAVHMGGKPPFINRGSMQSLRDHAEGSLVRRDWTSGPKWERCSAELRGKLARSPPADLQICCPDCSRGNHPTGSVWHHYHLTPFSHHWPSRHSTSWTLRRSLQSPERKRRPSCGDWCASCQRSPTDYGVVKSCRVCWKRWVWATGATLTSDERSIPASVHLAQRL